ncbi:hypothetical protein [Micromonospora sp. NPDC005237]|uniref:hypothetical protein n=1 Tax=Micromonospora sp. NPDC005237 TaxID=3155113 RepID=UPI0033BF94E9
MTLLRDVIEIPTSVGDGDFVVRAAEGADLRRYVVTDQIRDNFAEALRRVGHAVTTGRSRANATLTATLGEVVDPVERFDGNSIRLREDVTPATWRALTADAATRLCLPEVNDKALDGLKFGAALPKRLAAATLAARLADLDGAAVVLDEPVRFVVL